MKLLSFVLLFAALSDPQFKQGRTLYYQGADGNNDAYASADKIFVNLYRDDPKDPRIEVYYGSLRLLEASHTWALWKKNSLSKEGILLMDDAVRNAPSDLEVRFVRAATTYDLPGFFHRKQQSEQDFAYLADHVTDGSLEPRLAAASLYYHAEFLRQAGKKSAAVDFWNRAIKLAPDSRAARDSRDELKKAG